MKLKFFFAATCIAALVACNNSSDNKDKKEDTAGTNMSDHQMPSPSTTVPALPAVPEGAKVLFSNLRQDDAVTSPLKVKMGVEGIRIDTAGPVVAGSGHHHIIIDGPDSLAAGEIVPMDSTHLHFGKGQTETQLNLSPGQHRITLQFADGLHRSYGGKLATSITVTVKK